MVVVSPVKSAFFGERDLKMVRLRPLRLKLEGTISISLFGKIYGQIWIKKECVEKILLFKPKHRYDVPSNLSVRGEVAFLSPRFTKEC